MPLVVSSRLRIPDDEIELLPIRAGGPGGQHVNKVATAVHLRFDIRASSLPERYKQRLLASNDRRINRDGVLVIKAQGHRSREQNREEAYRRLAALIRSAGLDRKRRIPTRPTAGSKRRRLDDKRHRSRIKSGRGRVGPEDA
ncbi:MAG TPA: aminoacyl-tRNA hydrolase [Sedimenticola thiotaurini]|uniref:Aminoacyl-tRNA hydrolase n=1 Tax=Sedimenticola thiotaurini TaxID=1543721 RepID=A0A831W7X8_9GAMM|nr:aminoacyl-tRNA hydrolase [Sedimenticola thiotaurini]